MEDLIHGAEIMKPRYDVQQQQGVYRGPWTRGVPGESLEEAAHDSPSAQLLFVTFGSELLLLYCMYFVGYSLLIGQ